MSPSSSSPTAAERGENILIFKKAFRTEKDDLFWGQVLCTHNLGDFTQPRPLVVVQGALTVSLFNLGAGCPVHSGRRGWADDLPRTIPTQRRPKMASGVPHLPPRQDPVDPTIIAAYQRWDHPEGPSLSLSLWLALSLLFSLSLYRSLARSLSLSVDLSLARSLSLSILLSLSFCARRQRS